MIGSRESIPALFVLAALTWQAHAGDWPQILGVNRDGTALDEDICVDWALGGPPAIWKHDVGSGLAGPAVCDKTLVIYHRIGGEEIAEALHRDTGKVMWQATFPTDYAPSFTADDGPRVVPIIEHKRVFLFGATGELRCLELSSGRLVWQRNTFEEFCSDRYRGSEPPEGYFGVGSSPIVVGAKIIVNVGGSEKEAGIVAFDKTTGKTLWKSTSEYASYSSPVLARVDGTNHLLFATRLSFLSLNPDSGEVYFQFPFGRKGPTVTAANPIVINNHVFITASYGIGSALFKLDRQSAELVWRDEDLLASQYTTCVEHEGCLIGIDGRQDGPEANLKCIDPFTRTTRWTEPAFGYATLLKAASTVLALKTDGTLVAIAPTLQEYRELSRTSIFTSTTRALPALSKGRLYLRNTHTLKCVDLTKKP